MSFRDLGDVVTPGGKINLAHLAALADVAKVAANPYLGGGGYYSATGTAIPATEFPDVATADLGIWTVDDVTWASDQLDWQPSSATIQRIHTTNLRAQVTAVTGSPVLTGITGIDGSGNQIPLATNVVAGMYVISADGQGIPIGTFVLSVDSGAQVTLTNPVTSGFAKPFTVTFTRALTLQAGFTLGSTTVQLPVTAGGTPSPFDANDFVPQPNLYQPRMFVESSFTVSPQETLIAGLLNESQLSIYPAATGTGVDPNAYFTGIPLHLRSIAGGSKGQIHVLWNAGTVPLVLMHEDLLAVPANRLDLVNDSYYTDFGSSGSYAIPQGNHILAPGAWALLIYDDQDIIGTPGTEFGSQYLNDYGRWRLYYPGLHMASDTFKNSWNADTLYVATNLGLTVGRNGPLTTLGITAASITTHGVVLHETLSQPGSGDQSFSGTKGFTNGVMVQGQITNPSYASTGASLFVTTNNNVYGIVVDTGDLLVRTGNATIGGTLTAASLVVGGLTGVTQVVNIAGTILTINQGLITNVFP